MVLVEFGTWKDGSSIYKDSKGYYIFQYNDKKGEEYKKYLKNWKPNGERLLYLKKGKWTLPSSKKSKKAKKVTGAKSVKKTQKKYATRPSPPFPANEHCGESKKGNDGKMYMSIPNKKGICRWIKV